MALCNLGNRRNWNKIDSEEFQYIDLIGHLQELREYGFFYTKEWFGVDESNGKNSLWKYDKEWLERVISKEWLQKSVEEISMEFEHYLTGEKKYLHVVWEKYGYREGKRVRLFISGRKFIGDTNFMIANKGNPCFEKVLCDCDIYADSKKFRQISEYAIRCKDESFFSALCKNQYRQTKVLRTTHVGEECAYRYWAGEFVQEAESSGEEQGEAEYLYLAQLHKCKQVYPESSNGMKAVSTKFFMLKTKERRIDICLDNETEVILHDMQWQNRPFSSYYDLPEEEYKVERLVLGRSQNNEIERFLVRIKEMGYMYRREQVWVAGDEEKGNGEVIKQIGGFCPEYLKYGLNKILMEFVKPTTGERVYISMEPKEQMYYMCNGIGEEIYDKLQTVYFREDRSPLALFYGEVQTSSCEDEIILPEPVCLELLKKYNLIQRDQIILCRLSGQREFQDWFERKSIMLHFDEEVEYDAEFRLEELERVARARRIARSLRYQLTENCKVDGKSVEIYTNKQRDRAICLIDNGVMGTVLFVDRYMDVNEVLPSKG